MLFPMGLVFPKATARPSATLLALLRTCLHQEIEQSSDGIFMVPEV